MSDHSYFRDSFNDVSLFSKLLVPSSLKPTSFNPRKFLSVHFLFSLLWAFPCAVPFRCALLTKQLPRVINSSTPTFVQLLLMPLSRFCIRPSSCPCPCPCPCPDPYSWPTVVVCFKRLTTRITIRQAVRSLVLFAQIVAGGGGPSCPSPPAFFMQLFTTKFACYIVPYRAIK